MTRIILLGKSSFIARNVAKTAAQRDLDCLALPHDAPLDSLSPDDCVINFSLDPAYRAGAYDERTDCDLKAARATAKAGAGFVMLSTRRVYPSGSRWDIREDAPAPGDETAYGRNKAHSERAVHDATEGLAGVFRLSNIFGYEYDPSRPRRSFLGLLLGSLKEEKTIFFDMSPQTKRDFLPVELCAQLLLDRARERQSGTYNLGAGFPVACGELARWVCEGYGDGRLVCEPDTVRDEFYLNMDKWRSRFALPFDQAALRDYCIGLGRRLACEQS
jgi:nucleoside-diphosphate-sugar epimerase